MAFPGEDKGLAKKDGADITEANAMKQAIYEANSWVFREDFGIWVIDEDNSFPYHNYTPFAATIFPLEDKTLTGKDGLDITLANARKSATYSGNSWDMVSTWFIYEDSSFPYIFPFDYPFRVADSSLNWVIAPVYYHDESNWVLAEIYEWDEVNWILVSV